MTLVKCRFHRRFACSMLVCLVLVGGFTREQQDTFFLEAFAVLPTSTTTNRQHNDCSPSSSPTILFDSLLDKDDVIDDDDISQHAIMADAIRDNNNQNMTMAAASPGYRPIEDWHNTNRNPTHVLDSLKREQAHWRGKFEDLGGDGI